MRRTFFSAVPLFIAAALLVLAPAILRAQQDHDSSSTVTAGQACACCGNSGSEAMNHAGMDHGTTATANAKPMNHGSESGCCGHMAMSKGDGSTMPMAVDDPSMISDMQVFHYLLDHRADIRRIVSVLPNGIDTLTESDKPEIAATLKTHVSAMYGRLKDNRPIHQRDPLFAELFAHADQIHANITYTEKGLRVVETSDDPAVAHLLHMHAAAVDGFITNGMAEMMKDHPVN